MALTSPRFARNKLLQKAAENNPPLVPGTVSEAVRLVQQALLDLNFQLPISLQKFGSPDGIYGEETTDRVREFQKKHGLKIDGIAGQKTLAKLDALLPNPAPDLTPLFKIRTHLRSINIPVVSEITQLDLAIEIYREYSFLLEMTSGMSLLLSDEEQLTLTIVDGDCEWDQVSDDQRLLQSLGGRQGVLPNDVLVYFSTVLKERDVRTKDGKTKVGQTLQGCAGHPPQRPAAMIAASAKDPTTMAHEVGHVLLGSGFRPVHTADASNLMCEAAICTGKPPILTPSQVLAMRKSPFVSKL
jgi:hypothetical protein